MSLYGVMRTGVSGMNAQSSKLGTVADNIANSNTTGYKRSASEFTSMVLSQGTGAYNSGGVQANTVRAISQQGTLSYTTSSLNLAIDGNGFFVVADRDGTQSLTRAGAFVIDKEGYLVNTAGFTLQGYPINGGVAATRGRMHRQGQGQDALRVWRQGQCGHHLQGGAGGGYAQHAGQPV